MINTVLKQNTYKMKKLLIIICALVLGVNFSFSQETAKVKNATELTSLKDKGVCEITLPSNMTKDAVETNGKYYTHYFTIVFDEASKKATFTMVENNERSRSVIVRFLAACNVDQVDVAGTMVTRDDLFVKYLK